MLLKTRRKTETGDELKWQEGDMTGEGKRMTKRENGLHGLYQYFENK